MFLMSLHHLQCLFPMHSVVNVLFLKKIQNTKIRKIKIYEGTRCGKKNKLKDQIIFELLGHRLYLETK
jgi:hypothetical protein